MKYGLEKEFFVLENDLPVMVNLKIFGDNYDNSGVLVECRSKPYNNILETVFSLEADIYKTTGWARHNDLILSDNPVMEIPKKVKLLVQRNFTKEVVSFQNLYGYETHRNNSKEHTAGIHISFTQEKSIHIGDKSVTYNSMFDYVQLFRYLDVQFKEEIKSAKRNPGFYELKADGRIEYRSLPSNVSLYKLISVINSYKE